MSNTKQLRGCSMHNAVLAFVFLILMVVAHVQPAGANNESTMQSKLPPNRQNLVDTLTSPSNTDPNNPSEDQTLVDQKFDDLNDAGQSSIEKMNQDFIKSFPDVAFLGKDRRGPNGEAIKGFVNPALVRGASPVGTLYPPTPAAQMGWTTETIGTEEMYRSGLNQLNGFNGNVNSDLKTYAQELQAGNFMARTLQYPTNVANQARAQALATANAAGNAMGDMAKGQSSSAISYCSSFMRNFTAEEGNRWNKIRNGLFVPIAILLLLPGAILTQIKAMVSAGNPTLGDMNPFDGILRSVVAIFLIPATFLVVNYGIDFSNSIVASIASTYQSVMGRNMYKDAQSAQFRAFPVRSPRENQNTGSPKKWPAKKIENRSDYEDVFVANKYVDPSTGEYVVPQNKTDEAMPAGAVAARELAFGTNAALTAAWNILCAFQMAYLAYLFFVGPIVAALWVYPMKQFRDALPNWIEGVCTVCFWSLFWNTAILLMACFKGVDESGTMIMTALNFLATSSVKYAFDFSGLVKAAGQQAAQKAMEKGKGGAGAQGAQGSQGASGATGGGTINNSNNTNANTSSSTNSPSSVNTQSSTTSPTITPMTQLNSFIPADNNSMSSPLDFLMPPLSLKSEPKLNSQTAQLGNYVISRAMHDGKEEDVLLSNGNIVAVLPNEQMAMTGITIPVVLPDGASVNASYDASTATTTYSLSENGMVHTAAMDSMNGFSFIPAITPYGDGIQDHALALKSQSGTLLLEDGGRTVLIPQSNGGGYDSYSLEQGAKEANFELANGSNLTISTDQNGNPLVSMSNNGVDESFVVSPDAASKGFFINHDVNGQTKGATSVASTSNGTVYTNIDAMGNVTDRDTIGYNKEQSAYQISTEYFDPSTKSPTPIGTAVRTYNSQGGYTAVYRDATNVEVARANHVLTAGGGFTDSIYEGDKLVSVQNATRNVSGGFDFSTDRYKDGAPVSSSMVSYDAAMNVVSSSPVVASNATVSQFMSRISNTVNTQASTSNMSNINEQRIASTSSVTNTNQQLFSNTLTNAASSGVFSIHDFENDDVYQDGLATNFEASVTDSLQQQISATPVANVTRPRGLSQVFNSTRPTANQESAPQSEKPYTW